MTSRRDLLQLIGATSLLRLIGGCGSNAKPLDLPADASYDDVLDEIHRTDVEFGGGLSNHAAMAAEALVALGLAERVAPFVASYAAGLPPFVDDAPLPVDQRALGDITQRFAWINAFDEEIQAGSPWEIAARELPRLIRGWAAVHGILRVGHALRALDRGDTPQRRRELAFGLGYAAADYSELPGVPGARAQVGLGVVEALAAVPLVPDDERVGGLILERFAVLEGRTEFIDAVEAVDLDALPVELAISELAAAAARIFVNHGSGNIAHLHAITGTSALRLLLPVLDLPNQRAALGHAFQAVAAAHAVSSASSTIPDVVAPARDTAAELVERARATSDEHRIKLVEACLREHAIDPRPELLSAAGRY